MSDEHPPRRIVFDWTVNLSHIGFAVGLLGTIVLFMWSMRDYVRQAGMDLKQMVSELRNENKLQDQVIQQNAAVMQSNKAEETAFRSEMRTSISSLDKLLTDIRIQAAAGNNKK